MTAEARRTVRGSFGVMQSVFEAFGAACDAVPDGEFLIVPSSAGAESETWRYGDVFLAVEHMIVAYGRAGYGHGHRVALLLGNRPGFFVHYLALNALGVSIVPINPDYRHDEIRHLLEHSEAVLAVVTETAFDAVSAAGAGLGVDGGDLPVVRGVRDEMVFPVAGRAAPNADRAIGSETECALLYTSGTTGRPKGCVLSNDYFLTAGACYRDHGGLIAIRPGCERFYNPLPLYHMNHLAITATAAMLTRNALVLTPRFSPTRWWGEIVETGATVVHYLGIVAATLLSQPVSALERQHTVRFGLGAGVEPELHGPFEARFGFPLCEVWGMTETGRVTCACVEPREIETRAFGRSFAGLEARVVDENDAIVADGVNGELVVRHSAATPRAGFFSGYLKDEAATDAAWRGGWFHTGDVVRRSATGMLYFVDRKKNIIRRSGENIAAAEVEAALQAHEAVAQVAVMAVPDDVREEEVFAVVVPMAGVTGDAALARALVDWCGARLAYFKVPGWVLFVDDLPTTGTQKVQKARIFGDGEDPLQRSGVVDVRAMKKRDGWQ